MKQKKSLQINFLAFLLVASCFFTQNSVLAQSNDSIVVVSALYPIKVVIDAGHGGKDPGNVRSLKKYKHEKDLNLAIALKVGKYIEERVKNCTVLYTRKEDKKVSLDNRVLFANKSNADYFISIHCNSLPIRSVTGTEIHIQNHKFKTSKELALELEKQFSNRAGRKNRGIRDRRDRGYNYQVLQYTTMPGVLIECGYMSNPEEEKYLNSEYGQDIIASAIFRAFRNYVSTKKKPPKTTRSTVFKVQLMSSFKKVNLQHHQFKRLKTRVEEVQGKNKDGKTYYIYYTGREYDKRSAEQLAIVYRKKGFKDAFVVKVK